MDPETTIKIGFYVIFLLSTTCHEAAHAWVAKLLGDSTAYLGGQVSLDPMPHIRREPVGMVIVPILSLMMIGWPMGYAHIPVDRAWSERYPRKSAWVSVAGPAANLALLLLAVIGIRIGLATETFVAPRTMGEFSEITLTAGSAVGRSFAIFLSLLFVENLVLLLFNLIPVPPLDGSGALPLFTPKSMQRTYADLISQPTFQMMGIIAAWMLFPGIFSAVFMPVVNLVYTGVAHYG
ncbi:Peptidase family M50 [Planctomycetes bacterium Poly30]|uniref:Peptidase family M50 n=1 Tax=Saltatorellus ferox TaxID=2528018 RepID=A0A518F0K1_9BACT|nr:Peptidase family M50 [Planctomycetes bacterium Poly30]